MPEEAIAPGEVGGGQTIGRGEGHFDDGVGGQVRTQAGAGLTIVGGQRADDDGSDGQLVFLLDDQTEAGARGRVDSLPAEQAFDRRGVAAGEGRAEIFGQHADGVRPPPRPDRHQQEAEQQAEDRREGATGPR